MLSSLRQHSASSILAQEVEVWRLESDPCLIRNHPKWGNKSNRLTKKKKATGLGNWLCMRIRKIRNNCYQILILMWSKVKYAKHQTSPFFQEAGIVEKRSLRQRQGPRALISLLTVFSLLPILLTKEAKLLIKAQCSTRQRKGSSRQQVLRDSWASSQMDSSGPTKGPIICVDSLRL